MSALFWGGVALGVAALGLGALFGYFLGRSGTKTGRFRVNRIIYPERPLLTLESAYIKPQALFSLGKMQNLVLDRQLAYKVTPAGYYEQIVYFATDRDDRGEDMPPKSRFGNRVASDYADVVFGTAVVTIPQSHKIGELESPFRLWRIELPENPKKHVTLESVHTLATENFYAHMQEKLRDSARSYALVFIHGYNVTFEDAARRTAQMAFDLSFTGPAIFYSWPSAGDTKAYLRDEETIRISQANIASFLADFADSSGAEEIYVIGHSMGTRALAETYVQLFAMRPELKTRFREIILAAPDINQTIFRQQILPAMQSHGVPVTLYASSKDRALVVSKMVHDYPRLGDSSPKIVLAAGMDSIDASMVDTEFLGHSYFAQSILSDIHGIIENNLSAEKRFGLKRVETEEGIYWEFAAGF